LLGFTFYLHFEFYLFKPVNLLSKVKYMEKYMDKLPGLVEMKIDYKKSEIGNLNSGVRGWTHDSNGGRVGLLTEGWVDGQCT